MSGSATPKANYMFVPWPLEPVQIIKMTLKLYPVIDSTIKPPECAHAFQINETALAAPGINCRMMLDSLGTQLNLSAIIDSILSYWHHHIRHN
jgi:hypothetical protein